ncbi:hypothetical protein, partial [Escherichia coli]|uniref:hypothetical protein n=1 Tax=Escherichia coli TaxID=562 RepID=UPI00192309DB
HDGDAAIGGTQVDTDDFAHVLAPRIWCQDCTEYKLGSDVGVPSGFSRPNFEKLSILAGFSWESTRKRALPGKNVRFERPQPQTGHKRSRCYPCAHCHVPDANPAFAPMPSHPLRSILGAALLAACAVPSADAAVALLQPSRRIDANQPFTLT